MITWYIELYMHTLYTVVRHAPHSSSRDHNSSTAHRFNCCIRRLKQSRTSLHAPGPQPGLTTASGRDDAVDVSHRQELSTKSDWQLVHRYTRTVLLLLWACEPVSLILPNY